jgi:thioredoxin-related protein
MFKSLVIHFIFLTSFIGVCANTFQNSIDIDRLSQQAKQEHKYLLLFFHKFGCGYCRKMRDVTFDDEKVERMIEKHFIFVDIGIDDAGQVKHKNFIGTKHGYAKSLEIGFYPTVGFVDGDNSMVYGVIGYRGEEAFLEVLQYVETASYRTMDLEDFRTKLDFEREE